MRRSAKIIAFVACTALTFVAVAIYGLFHGYFDHGQFEIKQVQWSAAKQMAMVAERSDQEAMSSYTYFVLIGNHVLSPVELRHAYHSNAPVFAAANSCLDLRWESPSKLVVACNGSYVDRNQIDVQKRRSGEVTVAYENISIE